LATSYWLLCLGRNTIASCLTWKSEAVALANRVNSDEFLLTHEFLSLMLGVRRASVSVVAAILQQAGFIRYRRGKITILNREGLESASCECYQVIKQESDRLLG
jgi:CRP-like cAMP-binding protein